MLKTLFKKYRKRLKKEQERQQQERLKREYEENPKGYWDERHSQHSINSLQGVGCAALTPEENKAWHSSGGYIFRGVCSELELPAHAKVLEIGYGNGFYTQIISDYYPKWDYTGVDISNVYEDALRNKFPQYAFHMLDAGTEGLQENSYDLIFMIDVSQHIVDDEKYAFCLKSVRKALRKDGVFIVTDSLTGKRELHHVTSRKMNFYEFNLGLPIVHTPIFFRGKYLFSFKKQLR